MKGSLYFRLAGDGEERKEKGHTFLFLERTDSTHAKPRSSLMPVQARF